MENTQDLTARFIDAATSDLNLAKRLLETNPEVEDAGFHAALVLGDSRRIRTFLAEAPELATVPGGPGNHEPLVYLCFSRFAHPSWCRESDFAGAAKALLRHGANPSAAFTPPDMPDNPLSCLYAAIGINNNPDLAMALLEAGANTRDNESLYHSTEHSDLACMKLLLAYGAEVAGTNALKHMLDREDLTGVQLLLAARADPNETNHKLETALHWAVWRERSIPVIEALLDHGANLNARRIDMRTAYAIAVQSGQQEVAALLSARGAETSVSEMDRFLGECAVADAPQLVRLLDEKPLLAAAPECQRLLADCAMKYRPASVRPLIAAGLPVNARGELGATALHWACWKGYPDIVKDLLENGASLTLEDMQFHGTAPGWFGHGVKNCHDGGGDYPAVARLLLAAGATMPAADLPTGNPAVDAVLREHGPLNQTES